MQIRILTALLLMGVCFVQVALAHPQQTGIQNNLIAKATQAIETIQSNIKQRVDDAIKTFNELKDQVNDLAQIAIEEAKQNLNEVVASAQKRIDAIKQKAEEIAADISPCLTEYEDRFKELFNKFLEDEVSCITNEVYNALSIIDGAIQIANDEWKTVEDLPEKLQACGTELSSLICINQLIVEMAKLQVNLAGKIAQSLIEVSTFVAGFKAIVGICAASQVAQAGIEAAGVVAEVAVCAATQTGNDIFENF